MRTRGGVRRIALAVGLLVVSPAVDGAGAVGDFRGGDQAKAGRRLRPQPSCTGTVLFKGGGTGGEGCSPRALSGAANYPSLGNLRTVQPVRGERRSFKWFEFEPSACAAHACRAAHSQIIPVGMICRGGVCSPRETSGDMRKLCAFEARSDCHGPTNSARPEPVKVQGEAHVWKTAATGRRG